MTEDHPDRIPHPTELGAGYAVARAFLEYRRQAWSTAARPRSDAYRNAVAGGQAIADLAADLGVATYRGTVHVLAGEVLRDRPFDAGPRWLHDAAVDLAERLEARRQTGR